MLEVFGSYFGHGVRYHQLGHDILRRSRTRSARHFYMTALESIDYLHGPFLRKPIMSEAYSVWPSKLRSISETFIVYIPVVVAK